MSGNLLFGRTSQLSIGIPPANTPNLAKIQDLVISGAWNAQATGLSFDGFHIDFEVTKTLKAEPNKAKVSIYNLASATRLQLSGKQPLVLKLDVGYNGQNETIYLGTVRSGWTERAGSASEDIVTHIESGDSEFNMATARVAYAQGAKSPKVPIGIALQSLADQLGVNTGNVFVSIAAFEKAGLAQISSSALHGNCAKRLTDLCKSIGFSWSIQNGAIQILPIGGALNSALAIVLGPTTGLVGSPTVDSNGILSAKALITPGLAPGAVVTMQAQFVKGSFVVTQTKHYGQTWGDEWYIEFQGKRYAS